MASEGDEIVIYLIIIGGGPGDGVSGGGIDFLGEVGDSGLSFVGEYLVNGGGVYLFSVRIEVFELVGMGFVVSMLNLYSVVAFFVDGSGFNEFAILVDLDFAVFEVREVSSEKEVVGFYGNSLIRREVIGFVASYGNRGFKAGAGICQGDGFEDRGLVLVGG